MKTTNELRQSIIKAGRKAVEHLISVAEEKILGKEDPGGENSSLAADRLKNAAATKKVAIFDAFDILDRIDQEESRISEGGVAQKTNGNESGGFAERRSK
jgi:hypothetical protein